MNTLTITGTMTTLTPFHMAHNGVAGELDEDRGGLIRQVRSGTAKFPCTLTYKVPMPLLEGRKVGDSESEIHTAAVPCLPATALRGKLRRHAADIIKNHFVSSQQRMTRKAYYVLQCGAFAGNAIGRAASPAHIEAARTHLFAGLFGGGPALFRSSLRTNDSYVHCTESHALGLQPMIAQPPKLDAYRTTFAHPFIRRDDMLDFFDPIAPRVIEDYEETFKAWQSIILSNSEERAGQRASKGKPAPADAPAVSASEAKKLAVKGRQAVEAVLPGLPFGFRLDVTGTDAQCGLVIQAIGNMFEDNGFGGMVRNGYGRFQTELFVRVHGSDETRPLLNNKSASGVTFELAARPHLDALAQELRTLTATSFDQVYMLDDAA